MGVDSWAFSEVAEEVIYNEMNPELTAAARHHSRFLGGYRHNSAKEISFDEFHNCLSKISEVSLLLQRFQDKQEAVAYLVKETGLPVEECASAYDIYRKMFD